MSTEFRRVIVERPKEYLKESVDFDKGSCKIPSKEEFRRLAKVFREQIENKPEEV